MNLTSVEISTRMQWVNHGQRISEKRDYKEVATQCQIVKVQKHCSSIMFFKAASEFANKSGVCCLRGRIFVFSAAVLWLFH